ncbi:MAG: peptidoglycan editing factor PgeF [Spirochaetes bacterium]|jgi:YfiH family protein|nr:peptidoglycan editing factor PgeF [Spirochaetota bacterium]
MMHLDLIKKESNCLIADQPDRNLLIGVAAKNCNTTNYALDFAKIRKYEKYCIHFETGATPDRIFFINQEHGNKIFQVSAPAKPDEPFVATADAMITDIPGMCLVIRTADCIPIFLTDPEKNCIGAVHSGWRGTQQNVAGCAIDKIVSRYGSKPENLRAYILPGIGAESYQVSEDVASEFPESSKQKSDGWYLDLRDAVVKQLSEKGLTRNNIMVTPYDTFGTNDLFFSHRKGDKGRNLNYIQLR